MAIDLYFLKLSPPSRAVLMTFKHLDIAVNIKNVDLRNGEHLTPEYAKINPAQKVPAINDNGFNLWESRAIMQYLCNKYRPNSSLYPQKDLQKRAIVDRLLNFDTFYFQSIREALLLKVIRDVESTPFQVWNYKNTLKLFNTMIGDNKYVAGTDLTLADLSFLATSTVLTINDFKDIEDLPKLKSWYERLKNELPYFDEINGDIPDLFKQLVTQNQSFYLHNKQFK